MPTFDRAEREGSRDRSGHHHHQSHSLSEVSRLSIPMWDSSDPDRAPPPLPVPPGSPSLATRSNASANIQAAAQRLSERASAPYTINPMPATSPDKSLIKGAQHRRMQSLQPGGVKDLRAYLDGMRSGSPERPGSSSQGHAPAQSPSALSERDGDYLSSPERGVSTPTPSARERDLLKDTPSLRPSTRSGPRALLGENTPPSDTMLTLQRMASRDHDSPLHEMTNSPVGLGRSGNSQNWEAISSSISNLTQISLALQKEMTQLNRRSKDNATDLVSLKQATSVRDEDIRKVLKDLQTSMTSDVGSIGRQSGHGLGLLDSNPWGSPPPPAAKTFGPGLPRSASHNSLFDTPGSPNPFATDGVASLAMLEKILRDMSTKEGSEKLLGKLDNIMDKHSKDNAAALQIREKVDELAEFIKQKHPDSQALVRASPDPESEQQTTKAVEAMSADILRLLHQIKESAFKSGGMSAEIKARVHELRGEVLGMGRELGKKLEEAHEVHGRDMSAEDAAAQTRAEVERVINQGLDQLKHHMESIIRESQQQMTLLNAPREENKGEEMFAAVKQALAEHSTALVQAQPPQESIDREGILQAVKDACEEFKPEIELQQFGLERDEILQVLKEGLIDYQQNREPPRAPGASMEEVMGAIQQALQDFNPPRAVDELAVLKEELLNSVKGCLEEFRLADSAGPDQEATRLAVIEAVKDGLAENGPGAPRELEISRDDLFDAVKASLDGSAIPFHGFGEQVLQRFGELIDEMKVEFKQYSAANGRDTEQVLDAVKDGLESLRAEIESYVDRAQDVTGKDEIVDVIRTGLEQLRGDVQGYVAEGPSNGRNEMLDYIKAEFEHLHEAVGNNNPRGGEGEEGRPSSTSEILAALETGFGELQGQVGSRGLLDETNEEVMEAMKAEFEALRDAIIGGSAEHKDEVLEALKEHLSGMHDRAADGDVAPGSNEDVIESMKEEFEHLREVLAPILLRTGAASDKDDIIDSVREAIDSLREHVGAAASDSATAEDIAFIKEAVDSLRETMTGGLVPVGAAADEGPLADIKARLDEFATANAGPGVPSALLEAIQSEFEQLKSSVGMPGGSRADTEEVLDAVRMGLDELRSHLEKKLENPEHLMSLHSQVLDALNEGLDNVRGEISKGADKPHDATVNYEILETLKDGLSTLRADIDRLASGSRPGSSKGGEMVLLEDPETGETREVPSESATASANDALKERMEVLFAQLQIKVEAMSAIIGDMPTPSAAELPEGITIKDDLVGIEDMLREIQESVAAAAAQEKAEVDNAVTKDDTDAIETLLRNTKAHLEGMVLPDPETTVTREQLDIVEGAIRAAHETVEAVSLKIDENVASKSDVTIIEVLVKDLKAAVEDLQENAQRSSEDGEEAEQKLTKTDLDVLGIICTEIKTKVAELDLPDPENIPTRADMEQLTGLIHDFRESHDKVKESYEQDIAVTAKAFDDRRKEAEGLGDQIETFKALFEEWKAEILAKFEDGESGVATLSETLKAMEDTVTGDEGVGAGVKELLETVKNEFERAHGSLEGIKVDHEQAGATLLEKHGEHKDAIVAAVTEKMDTCYDGMMSKYDDAQTAAEEKVKMLEEKALEQQEILASTKEMADELKLSIDTLGSTLTTFIPSFSEATEKIAEDSKTVFDKVDAAILAIAEDHESGKGEHQVTRDEVSKALESVLALQADVLENHPKFSMSLKEIHALVNQHYEHSQKIAETAQEHASAAQEQMRATADESKAYAEALKSETEALKAQLDELKGGIDIDGLKAHLEEIKGSVSGMSENVSGLPALMPVPAEVEKYDDSGVHEKLDRLVDLASEAGVAAAHMARLDEIHSQVNATAAEVSAFVALQNKQITDGHEAKVLEAEEVALLIERRTVQKDSIEAEITALNDEKASLQAVVEALRAEKDTLVSQKARLNADVSSLHTALDIRKEELHAMDAKADALERRILEGLIDHSRAMLLTKQTPKASSKTPKGRDLRVPSNASAKTVTSTVPDLQHHAIMKARPGIRRNGAIPNSGERRIMSLSQISRNIPNGAASFAPSTLAPSLVNAAGSLNRSQSVKHDKLRKRSWGAGGFRDLSFTNKENETVAEGDEDGSDDELSHGQWSRPGSSSHYDAHSRYSESRPTSSHYDSASHYDADSHYAESRPVSRDSLDSSVHSGGNTNTAPSESAYGGPETEGVTPSDGTRTTSYGTYDTGSYITGSDLSHATGTTETDADRRTSFGSTIRSTLGTQTIDEEDDDASLAASNTDPHQYDDDLDSSVVNKIVLDVERQLEARRGNGALLQAHGVQGKDFGGVPSVSDSGLGTDLPTAEAGSEGGSGGYFRGVGDGAGEGEGE